LIRQQYGGKGQKEHLVTGKKEMLEDKNDEIFMMKSEMEGSRGESGKTRGELYKKPSD
jgi:hypothetical protein